MDSFFDSLTPKKLVVMIASFIFLVIALWSAGSLIENASANEILIIQSVGGKLTAYTTPGLKPQLFGTVISWPKRDIFEFEAPIRFNDGGHGILTGSVQFEMPLDEVNIVNLYTKFRTSDSIKKNLIETITNKAVYMTGPLMSSTESYASRRNYLISYVEDQISNGVFRTVSREAKAADPITGQEKTITVVDIVQQNGVPQRQEAAVLATFGIKTFNFSIKNLQYEETVEAQIKAQQGMAMAVQTSIAEAKKAEQRKITTEENGKADAAKAKWDQEVIKAKQVTEAEATFEVAKLKTKSAEQFKLEQTLMGEGEAARKRAVMSADGALEKKLEAYQNVQQMWAKAFADYKGNIVPSVITGGGSTGNGNNAVQSWMELMGAKAAKDLSLDLAVPRTTTPVKQ